jgi:hypothetical protein
MLFNYKFLMNYIDADRVTLDPNETLNPLLLCLICSGIVIDPKQCESCEKLTCSSCLNNNTLPLSCPNCKGKSFTTAKEELYCDLHNLTIKSTCCERTIPYQSYLKHYELCPNLTRCPDCLFYYKTSEEHIICLKVSKGDNTTRNKDVILAPNNHSDNTVSEGTGSVNHNNGVPDSLSGREVFVHPAMFRYIGKCYVCKGKSKFNCYKCKGKLCKKCGAVSNYFRFKFIREIIGTTVVDFENSIKFGLFFPIISNCYLKQKTTQKIAHTIFFLIFYLLVFWAIDFLIMIFVIVFYICVIPLLFISLICTFLLFYTFTVIPLIYCYWLFYLHRKRKCERC